MWLWCPRHISSDLIRMWPNPMDMFCSCLLFCMICLFVCLVSIWLASSPASMLPRVALLLWDLCITLCMSVCGSICSPAFYGILACLDFLALFLCACTLFIYKLFIGYNSYLRIQESDSFTFVYLSSLLLDHYVLLLSLQNNGCEDNSKGISCFIIHQQFTAFII